MVASYRRPTGACHKKLDQSKVKYIITEKRRNTKNATIADAMGITVRYVQMLWTKFKNIPKDKIVFPTPMGKSSIGLLTEASS